MADKHILDRRRDDLLNEEGLYEDAQNAAIKRVIAWQIQEAMKAQCINKNKMAALMKTSRTQVGRFLDPDNTKVQLDTLQRAATAVGCRLVIGLERCKAS
ncbi:MAG: helix-turn-helix domain-containing protein [Acidobacteriota bacterium]|nr:helix-turn-helix domain-containing protein [Acidobacteriota bacterium]